MKSKNKTRMVNKWNLPEVLILCLVLITVRPSYSQQSLSQNEFNSELVKAFSSNNDRFADTLIRNNRLLVKPFVNEMLSESIRKELAGKIKDSKNIGSIASKAAGSFEKSFGERSLMIGVNYMTGWDRDQKRLKLVADSLYRLATRYRLGGEKENALDHFSSALEKYKTIGDERGEAEVLGGFGALYYNSFQNYEKALDYYIEALEKRQKIDDRQLIANTLNSLGGTYQEYKDFPRAFDYYDRAIVLRKEIGDLSGTRAVMINKSKGLRVFADQLNVNGNLHRAIETLQLAYALDTCANAGSETGEVLSQLGFLFIRAGEYKTAAEKLTEASDIMKEENDSIGLAGVFNHFGVLYQKVGRMTKAGEYLNSALDIYDRASDLEDQIPVIDNLGVLYYDLKDFLKAEEFYTRGLRIACDLNDSVKQADYHLNLANNELFLKELDKSRSNYEKALALAKTQGNPDLIWRITVGLAENYEQREDFLKAVSMNDSALAIIENLRNSLEDQNLKASFLARERYIYEDLIDFLETLHEKDMAKGYDRLAFSYAERSKSRVLLDLITSSGITHEKDNTGLITLDESLKLCPDNKTLILDYFVGDSSSCLWAISNTSSRIYKLPGLSKLREQVEAFRFSILDPGQGPDGFLIKAGTSLYNDLISPAESLLAGKRTIIIVPDGILNYLPFEALLTSTENRYDTKSLYSMPYLVRKYNIAYAPSLSVLHSLIQNKNGQKKATDQRQKLLAIGDPVYEDTVKFKGTGLPRLEYAGKEIENITTFFQKGSTEVYTRANASEENIKEPGRLSKFNYIHFATHGIVNEARPDKSSLLLTELKSSSEDGYLQASEIFNLRLNADLVTLSACQTGLGKLVRGEGMVGLTRAFLYAGASSVLVSLWNVSDQSTALLMGEFYKNLIHNKSDKAAALRKAQLKLISGKQYSHPFYWAPFILIGDQR